MKDKDGNILSQQQLLQIEHDDLKEEIIKVKEHIEQHKYGMPRDDYDQKLNRFQEIVVRLRVIEAELE